jgi:hypothetical protein
MFNLGDQVRIKDDFEGSITVSEWGEKGISVENCLFEVVSFEEYQKCHPNFAKRVKKGPTGKDAFLKRLYPKPDSNVFVLYPSTSLGLVEEAIKECKCPINRLWAGRGHYTGCPEI